MGYQKQEDMISMLNKVIISGRLVADPELRHTQSGVAVATFRIAVDRDFKDRETGKKKADFISVVAWRSTAEFVSRFFTKGRVALIDGRLQVREYDDKDGNRRTATEIVAENVYFGDSNKAAAGETVTAPTRPMSQSGFVEIEGDEPIPF